MKILQVYDALSKVGGGSQSAVLLWHRNLKNLGCRNKILTNARSFLSSTVDTNDLIFCNGLNINRLFPGYSIGYFNSEARSRLTEFKPDLVHIHEPSILSFQVLDWSVKNKIPVISTFHTDYRKMQVYRFPANILFGYNRIANIMVSKLQAGILKKSDVLTTPSLTYKNLLKDVYGKKIEVIYYPISDNFFKGKLSVKNKVNRENVHRLVTISRLSGEKNIKVLISAMKNLDFTYHLTVIGDGIDKSILEKHAKDLSLTDKVSFPGWIDNTRLPEVVKDFDLFISASDYETFGITYIEALVSGLPVISFDNDVAREVIPQGCGIFVPTLSPIDWSGKISEASEKQIYKKLRENISRNYGKFSKYEEKASSKTLLKLYKNILSQKT